MTAASRADLGGDVATVERIAREAGAILLEGWERRPTIHYKSAEKDIVTEYDRRAEAAIVARLRQEFPGVGIVGEEGTVLGAALGTTPPTGATAPADASAADAGVFYVDPLDGTVNFAHGLPFFSVSIGLFRGGRPVLGVVHAPVLGWTFVGAPGWGAFRDGKPIAPSPVPTLDRALLVTSFPTPLGQRPGNMPSFVAFNGVAEGLRRLGSAALDLCFVACGWLDGTWQRSLQAWDSVGGAAIIAAAGATITELDGGPFDPLSGGVLASNGHIHQEMVDLLARLGTPVAPG
jgi:myo-inositol-1(or 4)-monophosphatase